MTRNKSSESATPELLDAVSILADELKILRIVIDELREEVQWSNHNRDSDGSRLASRPIHSCSLDPTSRNFEVNTIDQETLESLRAELAPITEKPVTQRELFN